MNSCVWFAAVLALLFANLSRAAELKPETISAWEDYVQQKDAAVKSSTQAPGLALDDEDDVSLRGGKILVDPIGPHIPKRVPNGLIHDWVGTAFIPNASMLEVLAAVRDYDHYKEVYHPAVIDSKVVSTGTDEDRFSVLLINKEVVKKKAIEGDYRASYVRIDDRHWYSIAESTRVQEIEDYGAPNQRLLPEDHGAGLIWRVHTITKYDEQEGGVFMQVEAMVLSRDVPAALRLIVNPIVRRVSRSSLQLSLSQTRGAIESSRAGAEAWNEKQQVR
jgi:hypothetical protein